MMCALTNSDGKTVTLEIAPDAELALLELLEGLSLAGLVMTAGGDTQPVALSHLFAAPGILLPDRVLVPSPLPATPSQVRERMR